MNIGIDVDGVIFDTENWMHAYAELFDIDEVGAGVSHPQEVLIEKMYDWSKETFDVFVDKYGYFSQKNAPIMPCAEYVINWLREQGHKLIIITARGKWGEIEKSITEEMFKKYNLKFDEICYYAFDKATVCKEHNIDYMIDDAPNNIDRLDSAGVKCLYLRGVNRKKIDSPNVSEVSNWGEIYRFFKELK